MLDDKNVSVLKDVVIKNIRSVPRLAKIHNLTKRQIEYYIEKANMNVVNKKTERLEIRDKNIYIHDTTRELLEKYLLNEDYLSNVYFSKETRQKLIFLQISTAVEYLSLNHILDFVQSSKTTVLNDLKFLRNELLKEKIEITYNRSYGYQLSGDETNIRYLVMKIIMEFLSGNDGEQLILYLINRNLLLNEYDYLNKVSNLSRKYNIEFFENKLKEFIYSLLILKKRLDNFNINLHKPSFSEFEEITFARKICELIEIENDEAVSYIFHWILGFKVGNIRESTPDRRLIKEMVISIIDRFESLSGIRFDRKNEVVKQLYAHFRPTYYRILYKFPIHNPLLDEIKIEYKEIFTLVQEALKPLEAIYFERLPEDEIAYITIHLTSFTFNFSKKEKEIQALIICPIGIGTSAILKAELEKMFPNISFNLKNDILTDDAELIFTTLMDKKLYDLNLPVFIVNPIMTNNEKYNLIHFVNKSIDKKSKDYFETDRILNIVEKHVSTETYKKILDDLFHDINELSYKKERSEAVLLSQIVSPELISLNIDADNWEEAIRASVQSLLDNDKVTQNYIDDMISIAKEIGPYIVITKNVALPHARPESGAKEIAISISTLGKPIEFGNEANDPVKYIFGLSAIDNNSHLTAMAELAELLEDEGFYEVLDNSKEPIEIYDYILKFEENEKYDKKSINRM